MQISAAWLRNDLAPRTLVATSRPREKGPASLNTEKFCLCEFDRAVARAMGGREL